MDEGVKEGGVGGDVIHVEAKLVLVRGQVEVGVVHVVAVLVEVLAASAARRLVDGDGAWRQPRPPLPREPAPRPLADGVAGRQPCGLLGAGQLSSTALCDPKHHSHRCFRAGVARHCVEHPDVLRFHA